MHSPPNPTERELEILKILWQCGEATVRQVYEQMRRRANIVQNTVQAFLRTMEEKGLVEHRLQGRTFIYRPLFQREQTSRHLVGRLLDRLYDGAVEQLVDSLLSIRQPTDDELHRLEILIAEAKSAKKNARSRERADHEQRR
jgi:BlaI family penicillinase repressor